MNLKETYNRIAEDWHRDHQKDNWWIEGTDKFISFLKKGDLVLDVGCGAGTKSKYLMSRKLKVAGIDFSEGMIKIAKKEAPLGRFITMDIDNVEKLPDSFDGIFMQAVLLHIPKRDIEEKLKKVTRKLKKGGYLYIAVKEKGKDGPEEEIKAEKDYGYVYERFFSYFSKNEIIEYLEKLDFELVYESVTSAGNTNWIQVIGRK